MPFFYMFRPDEAVLHQFTTLFEHLSSQAEVEAAS